MTADIDRPDEKRNDPVLDLISRLRFSDGQFARREQLVANFVNANLEEICHMTVAQVAAASNVSTPTVIRFCRTVGCDGFREFKLRLAQNLAVSLQYLDPVQSQKPTTSETAIDQILSALYATANVMRQQMEPQRLERAIVALSGSKQIVFAGIGGGSSMIAREAANRFFRLGILSVAETDGYLMQMRAATLGPGDTLLTISVSGEAAEIVSATRIAREYGAQTICISKPDTRLAELSNIAILAELPEDPDIYKPTASRYAHLVIVDALAMAVAQKVASTTTENLRRIRASLTAYHGRTGSQPLGD